MGTFHDERRTSVKNGDRVKQTVNNIIDRNPVNEMNGTFLFAIPNKKAVGTSSANSRKTQMHLFYCSFS